MDDALLTKIGAERLAWTSQRRSDGRWGRGWAWQATPRELAEFAEFAEGSTRATA